MKKATLIIVPIVLTTFLIVFQFNRDTAQNDPNSAHQSDPISSSLLNPLMIRDAVAFKNLEIFMIYGETTAENEEYVPLNRAMENDWVKITETSNVNELEISNISDHTIFVHAGDIIKGGKQDRTLTYDVIIEKGTKNLKISSFCVESNRWSQRGDEEAGSFSANTKILASRELKISSKKDKEQTKVWSEVEETQDKLTGNVSEYYNKQVDVQQNASASSLELALDNVDLKEMQNEYKTNFDDLNMEDAVGFAYAINGQLYNVDVYNNHLLFEQLFDKLLTAAIIEAIAELDVKADKSTVLLLEDLEAQLKLTDGFKSSNELLNNRTQWLMKEDSLLVMFTSEDLGNESKWIHHNIIIKGEDYEDDADVAVDEPFDDVYHDLNNQNLER